MIFGEQLLRKVLSGEKTETRRLVQPGHDRGHFRRGMIRAVQPGRGRVAVAQIRLVDVDRQLLGELDQAAAVAEGFGDRAGFARYWLMLHDALPSMRRAAARDPGDVSGLSDDSVLGFFEERHAGRLVWVLRFELVREQPPLLLSARPGAGGGPAHPFRSARRRGERARANAAAREYDPWPAGAPLEEAVEHPDARGYTRRAGQAMRDEPESVGDVSGGVASLNARQQLQRDRVEHEQALRELPLKQRIDLARRQARGMANSVITGDLYVLDRLVVELADAEVAGRGTGMLERRAERRLDAVAAKLAARRAA